MRTLRALIVSAVAIGASLGVGRVDGDSETTPLLYLVPIEGVGELSTADRVIETYGTFVLAALSSSTASDLAMRGILLERLNTTFGRGKYHVTDTIPAALRTASEGEFHLIQFIGPVKTAWLERLAALGAIRGDYVPRNGYVFRLPTGTVEEVRALPFIAWIGDYHPAFKLARSLPTSGVSDFLMVLHPHSSVSEVTAKVDQAGAKVARATPTSGGIILRVNGSATLLPALASIAEVSWVEAASARLTLDSDEGSGIIQGGDASAWPVHANGVNGSTQVVSICDGGLGNTPDTASYPGHVLLWLKHELFNDTRSSDPRVEWNAHLQPSPVSLPGPRKVVGYYTARENAINYGGWNGTSHGEATAGALAGDSPTYLSRNGFDGVAHGAKLVICATDLGTLADQTNFWAPAKVHYSANISSLSLGAFPPTWEYTIYSRQNDAFIWSNRSFTITRSMGNTGASMSMRTEAAAKNVIGVGATENKAWIPTPNSPPCPSTGDKEKHWCSSNRGPTADGRLKPNVVAPGACVTLARFIINDPSPSTYECDSGTSYSTPIVAGSAALVRDYFAKGFYPAGAANFSNSKSVSAALVRATLQASGKWIEHDTNARFPNNDIGWGRVLLDDVLYFQGDDHRLLVVDEGTALESGQAWSREFQVLDSHQPLRIMLAWTDYPGTPGGSVAIVNDLDLKVNITLPTGQDIAYYGNNWPATGSDTPSGVPPLGPDRINVEEAVYRSADSIVPGVYRVRVMAHSTPGGPQPFALLIVGDVEWV